jgi:hypothetical protein
VARRGLGFAVRIIVMGGVALTLGIFAVSADSEELWLGTITIRGVEELVGGF